MKIILLIAFLFHVQNTSGQRLSEKELLSLKITGSPLDSWRLRYDLPKGTWVYSHYDTISGKYFLYDKTGNFGPYNYVMIYSCIFDENGNYYVLIDNSDYEAGRNEYIIFSNGREIMKFNYVNDLWVYKNGVIYFYYKENEKYYFAKYNVSEERLEKGKPYDEISYIYYPNKVYEGEPVGELAFTFDGKEIYGASTDGKKFIVTGSTEGKKYSDIDFYSTELDYNGNVSFIAKSRGKLWESRGDCFVVQGDKEYKKFDYIYGPIVIGPDNIPVYVGQDSVGEYKYRSYLMRGNEEIDKLVGSIFDFKFSPQGILTYIKSKEIRNVNETRYEAQLVSGAWKSKKFKSVYNVQFSPDGDLYYTASEKDNKVYCFRKDERVSESFDNVFGITWLEDGRFAYIGTNFGNYEQKIPDENYYFIGDKRYGPFEVPLIIDYVSGSYFMSDISGNFVFNAGRNTDKVNYNYKYSVHSNKFTSEEFSGIVYTRIINGKIFFISNFLISSDPYIYKFRLYVDNKQLGEEYDSVGEIKLNDKGNIQFIAIRSDKFYLVEVEL